MKLSPLFLIAALAACVICGPQPARAQKKPVEKIDKAEKIDKTKVNVVETEERVERAVSVEPGVVITLCMESGKVTVRGGDRKEVRAHLPKGMEFEFHRDDVNSNGPAKRLEVLVGEADEPDERGPHFGQCSGSADIELDVPRDATLFFKSDNAEFEIDAVAEVHVETNGGGIFMRRITRAVEAMSNEGDVLLEDSSGRVRLESFGGSVEATNVSKNAEGDFFRARSISNDVWLENVSHSRVDISTISGEVMMRGPLSRAGRYDLRTTSGDITLTLPVDSSFQLIARVSEGGEIVTEFPLKYTGVSPTGAPTHGRMMGTHGKGDATLNLVSFSGTLRVRRQ
jgi:DUF4097 and DUF4098 domain-containing protein YvlB